VTKEQYDKLSEYEQIYIDFTEAMVRAAKESAAEGKAFESKADTVRRVCKLMMEGLPKSKKASRSFWPKEIAV
jgi:hypothetical protein